jgi:hypothetical protein
VSETKRQVTSKDHAIRETMEFFLGIQTHHKNRAGLDILSYDLRVILDRLTKAQVITLDRVIRDAYHLGGRDSR